MARFVAGEEKIRRAAERLRGQLVLTPVIGDVRLRVGPGQVLLGPRVKAECLQTGGTLEYRGALHYVLRRLGALKGVLAAGPAHRLLACARAAASQRLPMIAFCEGHLPRHCRDLIESCGARVEESGPRRLAAAARETGYHVIPWVEAEDYALGVATLGLELGGELPGDLDRVYVSPGDFGPAIASGLQAAGHGAQVVAVDGNSGAKLRQAILESLNLHSEEAGAAALGRAVADGDVDRCCAILSC